MATLCSVAVTTLNTIDPAVWVQADTRTLVQITVSTSITTAMFYMYSHEREQVIKCNLKKMLHIQYNVKTKPCVRISSKVCCWN